MLESASVTGPEEKVSGPAKVVDLRQYRLLRLMQEAGRQQQEVAEMMRESAHDRARIAESLRGAQQHLSRAAEGYTILLARLERERDFRDACLQATELEDLDEMIRRRDALAEELAQLRRDGRRPVTAAP
jgi:hypothetical protein